MPVTVTEFFGIKHEYFAKRFVFDVILDVDTRFFIDPHLLQTCSSPEFSGSYQKINDHFQQMCVLLLHSKVEGDVFWKRADKLIDYREVRGLCMGYAREGTAGSGIGPALRERILKTAKSIIDAGRMDPVIFELVGLFETDIGPDRISDMTARIIADDIQAFTSRIFSELEFGDTPNLEFDEESKLPINPFNRTPILLVPKDIIRDLPMAFDWTTRDIIAADNQELRDRINKQIGENWKHATSQIEKANLRSVVLSEPELIDDLVSQYKNREPAPYNFEEDPVGEYIWHHISQKYSKDFPLPLNIVGEYSIDKIEEVVLQICQHFKQLVENNGLNEFLYNDEGQPKHERAAQLLFFGIADAYCKANNILIARETDAGRGPVDFKFGTNYTNSILVEIKKSSNISGLRKGVERQLPIYMKSHNSKRSIYLVLDIGFSKKSFARYRELLRKIAGVPIKVIDIDGKRYPSASK
jgi:hypothetical protein